MRNAGRARESSFHTHQSLYNRCGLDCGLCASSFYNVTHFSMLNKINMQLPSYHRMQQFEMHIEVGPREETKHTRTFRMVGCPLV